MGHVHVIATQHLDVAWLWTRVPQGEDIMRQCFERACAMIEADPEHHFVFSRSTAWSFWVVQQRYPDLFRKIQGYVKAGRIELCGGEWVEPDHLIPSGESLVRQAVLGQWYYMETFGELAHVCWDPDIFGHAHTLPQIIRKAGMDGYYFHRCRPRDVDGSPLHQFMWEGPDGSRVYVLSGQWVGKPDKQVIQQAAVEMQQTGLPAAHVVTGLRSDRRITMGVDWVPLPEAASQDPELPSCSWSTATDVLNDMRTYQDQLPVVHGELSYQYTGTYTSNGFNKRMNRKLEALLLSAEKAATWAHSYGFPYQEEQLVQAWRDLSVNQFHDIICGTSYAEVHQEDKHLFAECERRAQWIRDQALAFMADRIYAGLPETSLPGMPVAVFDFATWQRTTPVILPVPNEDVYSVTRADGTRLPSQLVMIEGNSPGVLVQHQGKGIGYDIYYLSPEEGSACTETDIASSIMTGRGERLCLENALVRVEIDPQTGEVDGFLDKRTGEQAVSLGGVGNRYQFLSDGGLLPHGEMHSWEPWNIMYTGEQLAAGPMALVQMVETGPLRGRFRMEWRGQLAPDVPQSVIVQDIELTRDSAALVVKVHGTWYARQTMLKIVWELPFTAELIAVDVPYGTAERVPHTASSGGFADSDTLAEDNRVNPHTVPEPDRYMQKWLDASDGQRGLLFLNNGLYGYDAGPEKIRLSGLRSPLMRPQLDEIIGLGPFSFAYAVMPHMGGWREINAPLQGYAFNNEPVCVPVQPGKNEGVGCGWWDLLDALPAGIPQNFLEVTGHGVIGTVLKRAHDDDGVIVRLYESFGNQSEARLSFIHNVLSAVECDFLERNVGSSLCAVKEQTPPVVTGCQVVVAMEPFEIKTLRISLQ